MDLSSIDAEKITVAVLALAFALGLLKVIDRHLVRQDASLPTVTVELKNAKDAVTGLGMQTQAELTRAIGAISVLGLQMQTELGKATTAIQALTLQISEMRDDFTPRSRPVPVPRGRYGPARTSTPATGVAAGARRTGGDDDER